MFNKLNESHLVIELLESVLSPTSSPTVHLTVSPTSSPTFSPTEGPTDIEKLPKNPKRNNEEVGPCRK